MSKNPNHLNSLADPDLKAYTFGTSIGKYAYLMEG
jgi:hypothetical protein